MVKPRLKHFKETFAFDLLRHQVKKALNMFHEKKYLILDLHLLFTAQVCASMVRISCKFQRKNCLEITNLTITLLTITAML